MSDWLRQAIEFETAGYQPPAPAIGPRKWPDWIYRDLNDERIRMIRAERMARGVLLSQQGNPMSVEGVKAAADLAEALSVDGRVKSAVENLKPRLPGSRESWAVSALDTLIKWPPGKTDREVSVDVQFMRGFARAGLEKIRQLIPDEFSPEERASFVASLTEARRLMDRARFYLGTEKSLGRGTPGQSRWLDESQAWCYGFPKAIETPLAYSVDCECKDAPPGSTMVVGVGADGLTFNYSVDCETHAYTARKEVYDREKVELTRALDQFDKLSEDYRDMGKTLELVRLERDRLESDLRVASEELAAMVTPWLRSLKIAGTVLGASAIAGIAARVFVWFAGF